MSYVTAALLLVWLTLTLLNQMRGSALWHRLQRGDVLRLLPNWSMFSGDGRRADVYLFVRHRLEDGQTTEWDEVDIGLRRSRIRLVNGKSRIYVAMSAIRSTLVSRLARGDARLPDVKTTIPYQMVSHYAATQPTPLQGVAYQFLIGVRVDEEDTPTVVPLVASAFHATGSSSPVCAPRPRREMATGEAAAPHPLSSSTLDPSL